MNRDQLLLDLHATFPGIDAQFVPRELRADYGDALLMTADSTAYIADEPIFDIGFMHGYGADVHPAFVQWFVARGWRLLAHDLGVHVAVPADWEDREPAMREAQMERAAILEFDAGLSCDEAERQAWEMVRKEFACIG